jgi:hypothetical protein
VGVVDHFDFGDALSTIARAVSHVARWFYRPARRGPPDHHPF